MNKQLSNRIRYVLVALIACTCAGQSARALDFSGLDPGTPLSGDWKIQSGALLQADDSSVSSVIVAPNQDVERCRVKARVRLVRAEKPFAEAGVAAHVENKDYYVICSIRRNKGGLYALLSRHGAGYDFGRMPGDMAPLPANSAGRWHTIEMFTDGAHVQAVVDKNIKLAFSFPLLNGMPVTVADQTKDTRLASNWGPEVFQRGGQVGLVTRSASAEFQNFELDNLPAGMVVHTPYNPEYDANGRVQARWPYAWMMKHFTEWFLDCGKLVSSVGANPEAEAADLDKVMVKTGWPPYFFTWATWADDMGFDAVYQATTHNGPPTISGYVQYCLFTGDERFLLPARQWADWMIDTFSTPADFAYPYLPKSTFNYLQAVPIDLANLLELDKASYCGLAYLDLWAATGDDKYMTAAKRIAEALKPHQRDDGGFPFRVNLKTGRVEAPYTCSQLWHAQLFAKLAELTGRKDYEIVSRRAMKWMLNGPVRTNKWFGFYGDNPDASESGGGSFDQWVALETAQWLCDHHTESPEYLPAVKRILSYIDEKFARIGGIHKGVPAIGEQTGWPAFLPHHNMRLAETYARYYSATGDPQAKELALRIANSMTQMVMADGKFHHGLNSGIENRTALVLSFNQQFSRIMAEIPETAPRHENHLLYNSGFVRGIEYSRGAVSYQALEPGQDVFVVKRHPNEVLVADNPLKRTEKKPDSRTQYVPSGWFYEPDSGRLTVLHPAGKIEVRF